MQNFFQLWRYKFWGPSSDLVVVFLCCIMTVFSWILRVTVTVLMMMKLMIVIMMTVFMDVITNDISVGRQLATSSGESKCWHCCVQVMARSVAITSSVLALSSRSFPSSTQTFRCRSSGTWRGSWWTFAATRIHRRRWTWFVKFYRHWQCLFTTQTPMYARFLVSHEFTILFELYI